MLQHGRQNSDLRSTEATAARAKGAVRGKLNLSDSAPSDPRKMWQTAHSRLGASSKGRGAGSASGAGGRQIVSTAACGSVMVDVVEDGDVVALAAFCAAME